MQLHHAVMVCALFVSLTSLGWEAKAEPRVYEGGWKTTNRKLDGTMTAIVTERGREQWQGRFYGVWQGVPFDYTVSFAGPSSDLRGTAVIDGADYQWKGTLSDESPRRFTGSFGGSRYTGYFDLQAKGTAASR